MLDLAEKLTQELWGRIDREAAEQRRAHITS